MTGNSRVRQARETMVRRQPCGKRRDRPSGALTEQFDNRVGTDLV